MLGYLFADIILFREVNSFLRAQLEENCELKLGDILGYPPVLAGGYSVM